LQSRVLFHHSALHAKLGEHVLDRRLVGCLLLGIKLLGVGKTKLVGLGNPLQTARHVGGRIGVVIRSIWAYGSQARLILWGVFAFVLAFVLRFLHGQTATDAIEQGSDSLKPAGDWVASHGEWFDRAAQILFILGALAIALNLWRALKFSNLLLRGARLLTQETRERRQNLEARAARLNQRVAALTAEADAAAKRAEAASERAGGVTSMRSPGPEFLESSHAPSGAAREFLAALGAKVGHPGAAGPAPDRLIVVVDNLDALSPAEAVRWIDAAQGHLAGSLPQGVPADGSGAARPNGRLR